MYEYEKPYVELVVLIPEEKIMESQGWDDEFEEEEEW